MARDQFQTLTEPMYFTLLALGEVRNGAEITSWVSEITKGRIKLAPGTLYALLAQFLENDLITRVEVDKKGKYYKMTEEGRELLEEEVKRLRLLIENYENHFDKWWLLIIRGSLLIDGNYFGYQRKRLALLKKYMK